MVAISTDFIANISIASRQRLISCARGDAPPDLVLKNGRIINVFSGEILTGDVAVCEGRIAGVGNYRTGQEVDLAGSYLSPGFIEGHIHIESSMLEPRQFARAVLPHGTTAVVCDPHEIANVKGIPGIEYILESSRNLPVDIYAMAPSCVPATHMETAGATLNADDIGRLLNHPRVLGLAEMMNFPGTVAGMDDVLGKLQKAHEKNMAVDGHAPGLTGLDLQAYCAAGISSDHECTDLREAREKLRAGMSILIREGSTARNLEALLPLVTQLTSRHCLLVSDDRHPDDLKHKGHLDDILRKAISLGLDPVTGLQMVTLNPARRFGLHQKGAIAPGYHADLVVLEDLQTFKVGQVYKQGRLVAKNGRPLADAFTESENKQEYREVLSSVNIDWSTVDFRVHARSGQVRVIDCIEWQIVTGHHKVEPRIQNNQVTADTKQDILKLAVIERHHATGNMGIGFVRGFGMQQGAIASTVAHDSHNLLVVGASDQAMMRAVREVHRMGGGLTVAGDNETLASLPLPIAGLMSDAPLATVCDELEKLRICARELGCMPDNPFMLLSFLALPVIPRLKITDQGLVDVDRFQPVSLWC
ncbi:MAG: adenine deaminase [Desulfobulbaceae bacterium]|nr:adenine deaminase [Desulfobulbaceae bacterium]